MWCSWQKRLGLCAVLFWACGENASPMGDAAGSGGASGAGGASGHGAGGDSGNGAGGDSGNGAGGDSGEGGSGTGGDSGNGAGGDSGSGAGGDSGSGGTEVDAGLTTRTEYYPVISGASWTFTHVPNLDPNACTTVGACWDEVVSQTDSEWNDAPAMLLADDGSAPSGKSSESWLVREGTQVLRVHRESTKSGQPAEDIDYDPGFLRFDEAWMGMADGTQIDTSYTRIETIVTPGDPNLGMQTMVLRQQRYIIEGHEDLDVPAGHIEDCLRVRRVRRDMTMTGLTVDDKEARYWFCKGVGKVREDDLTSGGHELLKSCDVPDGNCPR